MTSENTQPAPTLRAGQRIRVTLELRETTNQSATGQKLVGIAVGGSPMSPAVIGRMGLDHLIATDPGAVEVVAEPEPDWQYGDFGVSIGNPREVFRYLPVPASPETNPDAAPWWPCNGALTGHRWRTAAELRGRLQRFFLAPEGNPTLEPKSDLHTHWCVPPQGEPHAFRCTWADCRTPDGSGRGCTDHYDASGRGR